MVGCSVLGCKSRSERKIEGITFHTFPSNLEKKKCLDATGRENWLPTKNSKICSIHFDDGSLLLYKNKRVQLKPHSVPTKYIHIKPNQDQSSNHDDVPLIHASTSKSDHTMLPNDMENYMQYSIMGSVRQIRMKPDCVPSRFDCQPDRAKRKATAEEQRAAGKRKRKGSEHKSSPYEPNDENNVKTEDDPLSLHEEISLPLSPSCIKQESVDEDSQTEHKVEDYETIIFTIKQEMAALRSENQLLNKENQRLADENQKLNDRNHNLTSGIDQLLQKSEDQMTNYEDIEDFTIDRRRMTKTIQTLTKEIEKHIKNNQEVTEQKQRLTERVKEFQQRVQQLTEDVKQAQNYDETQRLQKLNKKLEQENRELNEKIVELNQTISDLNKKLDDVNLNVEELQCRNKNLAGKIDGSRGRKTVNLKELAQIRCLTEENQSLAERVRELTEKLRVVNRENRNKMKRKRKLV